MLSTHFIVIFGICYLSTLVRGQDTGLCEFPCTWRQLENFFAYRLDYGIVEGQIPGAVIEHLYNFSFPADSPSEMRIYGEDNLLLITEECVKIVDQFIIIRSQGINHCLQITEEPGVKPTIQWAINNIGSTTTDECFLCHSPNQAFLLRAETDPTPTPTLSDYNILDCDTPRGCPDCADCDVCTDAESSTLNLECPAPPAHKKHRCRRRFKKR